jgi:hypothetical protein
MSTLEILILIVGIGLINVLCFLIGAKTGQKASKGEDITLPNLNPIEAVREHEISRQQKKEEDNFNTMLDNIEVYDGTSIGQKDFI